MQVEGTNLGIRIDLSFAGFIEKEFIRPSVGVYVKSKEKNSIDCWVIWQYANCTQLVFSLSDVEKQTIPRYTRTVERRTDLNGHRGWSCHCVPRREHNFPPFLELHRRLITQKLVRCWSTSCNVQSNTIGNRKPNTIHVKYRETKISHKVRNCDSTNKL